MKKLLLLNTMILLSSISVFGQTCEWAEKIWGTYEVSPSRSVVDMSGNIYIMGVFYSKDINFNNDISLTGEGYSNIFIAKYSTNKNCLWAVGIEGNGFEEAVDIALDDNNNIFIAGYYNSTKLKFNDSISLTNSGNICQGYVAKYNQNGLCQWAEKIFCGNTEDYSEVLAINVDIKGNVYVAGQYVAERIIFNNGKWLTKFGIIDAFLAKYNESGICQWAERISGKGWNYTESIGIDLNSNIYLSGQFRSDYLNDTLLLNNKKYLICNEYDQGYITKYNNNGICQWAEKISGNGCIENKSITIFGNNIYCTGKYTSDSVKFNDNLFLVKEDNLETWDTFIASYNDSGDCIWAQKIKGYSYDWSITTDKTGNIYLPGVFKSDTLNFNNGISLIKKDTNKNAFFAKYNSYGQCLWAEKITGVGDINAYGISVDKGNNVYVTGTSLSASINFNNNILLEGSKYRYGFITKYSQNNTSISDKSIQNNISVYPNPAIDYIEIKPSEGLEPSEGYKIQIFDMLGNVVASIHPMTASHRMNIENLAPGVYFIKIGNKVEKFVKL